MNIKITSNTNYPTTQVMRPQLGVENEPGSPDPWDGTLEFTPCFVSGSGALEFTPCFVSGSGALEFTPW
jgi:hypothetical protein